jgi:hypothetical protein
VCLYFVAKFDKNMTRLEVISVCGNNPKTVGFLVDKVLSWSPASVQDSFVGALKTTRKLCAVRLDLVSDFLEQLGLWLKEISNKA